MRCYFCGREDPAARAVCAQCRSSAQEHLRLLDREALHLIDELIACWSSWDSQGEYYLTVLAPRIVESAHSKELTDAERLLASDLRKRLSGAAWAQLPSLIFERRVQVLIEQDAGQRQAEEKAEEEREHLVRRGALLARLQSVFDADFLSADHVLATDADAELISDDDYDDLKATYVCEWAARELGPEFRLDKEQAAAVATVSGDVKVVARAGSGKTRAIVVRAIFLQRHCGVSPREILLLAFNKKAADLMKERLGRVLGEDLPHVMTFHALAYALVHPEEDLLVDDFSADRLDLSRVVQEVIDEHIRSQEHGDLIRNLMLARFQEDWERVVDGRFEFTMDEFLAHRRSLPRESLKGHYVRSFGEKLIANSLFEHAVEYDYERNRRWNGVNYRPDFTISNARGRGVVIEYFGLTGDADYDEMAEKKRGYWARQKGWTLLEYAPRDITRNGVDAFRTALLRDLQRLGIASNRRSEEEIWELVKRRAVDGFTKAMRAFISRCRKLDLSLAALDSMIVAHRAGSSAEALFLKVGTSIYRGYLDRLASVGEEDFDGVMWRSIALVRGGRTRFVRDRGRERGDLRKLRYLLVDEFQDFSMMFFELLDAVRAANPDAQFFCVGDDWQAINSFAGSDLRYFVDFFDYFEQATQRDIRTNYRSSKSVTEMSNALMRGRGVEALTARRELGTVILADIEAIQLSAVELERHGDDQITPALLRLIWRFLGQGIDVVLLSRTHSVPWYVDFRVASGGLPDALTRFLDHVRSYLPEEDRGRVTASNVHRYKGLEQSAVIVIDALLGRYPLLHPHWVFTRLFGTSIDQIEEEERRLFYVAATRAVDDLVLVTEEHRESPFVSEIERYISLPRVDWAELPIAPSHSDDARFEVRVLGFGTFNVKDRLKELGYRWHAVGKYWYRAVPAQGFSFEALRGQPWARTGVKVEVYSETGSLLHTSSAGGRQD